MMPGARLRAVTLPVVAAALISGVLGVQIANGGGDFAPSRPASPCVQRTVTPVSTGIAGLGERLVLLGLDGAACRLGVTREALTLRLAQPKPPPTDAEINAVRAGLLEAVDRMKADHTLPRPSELTDEALTNSTCASCSATSTTPTTSRNRSTRPSPTRSSKPSWPACAG
jgi:hypothetical protein